MKLGYEEQRLELQTEQFCSSLDGPQSENHTLNGFNGVCPDN